MHNGLTSVIKAKQGQLTCHGHALCSAVQAALHGVLSAQHRHFAKELCTV